MGEQAGEFDHGTGSSTYLTPPSSPPPSYNKVLKESLSREKKSKTSFHKFKEHQYRQTPQRSSTVCSDESYIFVHRPASARAPNPSPEPDDSAFSHISHPPSVTSVPSVSTATTAPVIDIVLGPPGYQYSVFGTYNLGGGRRGAISGPSSGFREGMYDQ